MSKGFREGYKEIRVGAAKVFIPKTWSTNEMKDLIKFKNGYAFSSRNYSKTGKIVFRMSNINRKGNLNINKSNIKHCDVKTYNKLDKYHLEKNDLVICMTDMNSNLEILGRTGVVDEDNKYILNQRVGRIRIDKTNKINYKYLHYYTNSKLYLDYIRATATGTAQFNTSTKTIKNTLVIIPPLPEQEKIASILSTVDEKIEKIDQIIEKTKELKKGMMQQLLTKGIGHSEFKEVMIGVKTYQIPKHWKVIKIADTTYLKGRIGWHGLTTDEYMDDGYFYLVTGTDFQSGRIEWGNCVYIDKERYEKDTNIQLKEKDVLLTKDGTIGKVAFIDKLPGKATLNSGVFVIRPLNNAYYSEYLYWLLNSFYFRVFVEMIGAGSTITHLYQKDFKQFRFPLPPLEEQKKIADILSTIDQKIQKKEEEKEKMETLKKGLMQKLLTGQVRVKV